MTAHHFFADDVEHDPIVLTGEEARHAARALRVRPGEEVTVGDGRGTVARGIVGDAPTAQRVLIAVADRTLVQPSHPQVRVFPAVPKAGKLDEIVQHLTEVGVDRITPWFAERSVARWDARKCRSQGDRLRAIARAAAKQSRRAWLPIVDDPGKIDALPPGAVLLHEHATRRLSDTLRDLSSPSIVAVICGPEGGLTDTERVQFADAGALEASLGPLVLRTETAAIVGSALVRNAFHLLG